MSALGHKRTCAPQKVMSALAPKADIKWHTQNVSHGSKNGLWDDYEDSGNNVAVRGKSSIDGGRLREQRWRKVLRDYVN